MPAKFRYRGLSPGRTNQDILTPIAAPTATAESATATTAAAKAATGATTTAPAAPPTTTIAQQALQLLRIDTKGTCDLVINRRGICLGAIGTCIRLGLSALINKTLQLCCLIGVQVDAKCLG